MDDGCDGPEGLIDGKAPGNTCKLNDSQRQALAERGRTARRRRSMAWFAGG